MSRIVTKQEAQDAINIAYGQGSYKVIRVFKTERSIKVEVECQNCGSVEEYVYKYFKGGSIKCICQKPNGLKILAKKYAEELYIEPEHGLILGEELERYILASIGYDKPGLKNNIEFIEMVEDFLIDIYEKKQPVKCSRCRKYYPKRMIKRGICGCCRKGI